MDFLEKAAMDGASRALTEKLASIDRFADTLKTIHEDLANGIELTTEKLSALVKPLNEAIAGLHKEIKALKTAPEIKTTAPQVDLSKIEAKLEAIAAAPSVDLGPVLRSLEKLTNRKPQPTNEEWKFDIEREKWSGRIETVNAKRVA